MNATAHSPVAIPPEIAEFVAAAIAPNLSTHLGGIRAESADGRNVRLRLTRSCATCYFRRSCIEELVLPELEKRFGADYHFTVR